MKDKSTWKRDCLKGEVWLGEVWFNVLSLLHNILVHDVSQPEVIIFSMGLDASRRRNRIEVYSCVTTCPNPIENSGCDASRTRVGVDYDYNRNRLCFCVIIIIITIMRVNCRCNRNQNHNHVFVINPI